MAWVIPPIVVEFEPVTELAFPPEQMTPGAAGYDLRSPREYTVQPEQKTINTFRFKGTHTTWIPW